MITFYDLDSEILKAKIYKIIHIYFRNKPVYCYTKFDVSLITVCGFRTMTLYLHNPGHVVAVHK